MHLINWEVLCRPKEVGGVGLKCAATMNKALLIKLAWRLLNEEEPTWSKVVRSKYGMSLDEPPIFRPKARASVIWRGLNGAQSCYKGV